MVKRYRVVEVPLDDRGKVDLIRQYSNRNVIVRDRTSSFTLVGCLHHVPISSSHYFLVDWSKGGRRDPLKYKNLAGLEVEVVDDGSAVSRSAEPTHRIPNKL